MNDLCRPTWRRGLGLVSLLGFAALAAGCQLMTNPFVDELALQPAVTTPSVEAARAVSVERSAANSLTSQTFVRAKDGTVTHGPLFYTDPTEDTQCDDGLFAWSSADYLESLYGPGRFLINSVLYPVRAISTPPWQAMESGGPANQP